MRRIALILPIAATLAALASLAPGTSATSPCAAAGSHRAAVVVEHADGSTVTRCVAFDTNAISGERLLTLSGIGWSSQSFGGFGDAVCALDGEPARYAECPGKDRYWAVFVARAGGSWQLANVGISTLVLHDGDAEGVRFVPASGVPAAPVSASGVCAAAATPAPRRSAESGIVSAPPTAAAATPTMAAEATTAATESPAPVAVAAVATGRAAVAAGPPYQAPTQPPPAGLDLGLLLAALVGGGLAGLAILRLVAGRRPGP
jgi:hypothetical protein